MDLIFLYITLTAEVVATMAVIISVALPHRRIWPPSRQHSWEGYCMWLVFIISGGGVIFLGIIDWGNFVFDQWARLVVGIPLWCAGNILALWSIVVLGIASTFGAETTFVCRGPYRFSRNPQYVGFIVGLVGWAILANSGLTLVTSFVGIIPLILVPFAEEPWLLSKYGSEYEEYKRTVPRFISWPKWNNM